MYIFYCAGGKFGEVAEVFLAEKHSPDAGVGSTGRWSRASGVVSVAQVCRAHWTLAPDAERLLFKRLVVCDVSECVRGVSDR